MAVTLDFKGDRGLRVFDIFGRLNRGEHLSKRELTAYYGVGEVSQVAVCAPKELRMQ